MHYIFATIFVPIQPHLVNTYATCTSLCLDLGTQITHQVQLKMKLFAWDLNLQLRTSVKSEHKLNPKEKGIP